MTEAEWLAGANPRAMLNRLRARPLDRKFRLLACACARRALGRLDGEQAAHVRRWAEAGERLADDPAHRPEFIAALVGHRDTPLVRKYAEEWAGNAFRHADAGLALAARAGTPHRDDVGTATGEFAAATEESPVERVAQAALLRDIFGNPFRPAPVVDSSRLPPAVVALARDIYDARTFDRMPELADSLERAGGADADVLAHCRGGGPHVRGCWVIDRILGKA